MTTRRGRGFTIIELLIVTLIVAILAMVAVPNMRDLIVRTRLKTAASDLHSSLVLARSEAIKRNTGMQIVPVSAGNWALGWSVQVQSSGLVLSQQDAYRDITFTSTNAAYVATAVPNVTYSGIGRETGSAGAGVAFVIAGTNDPKIKVRCVVVDPAGRAAVKQDADLNSANGCN
jgi:type IV fimbrial biogenesis protein FimT